MNINDFIGSCPQMNGSGCNGSMNDMGGSANGNGSTNGNNGSTNGNNSSNNGNGNQPSMDFPKDMPLGMMYVPFQKWEYVYEPQVAIERGTIFEALDKPFIGER